MSRDKELFWELLKPEYEKAMMFCRKLINNREKGDDLFQDSLYQALKKFHQLKSKDAFKAWLYRIIVNKFTSQMRKNKFRKLVPFNAETEVALVSENIPRTQLARIQLDKICRVLSSYERSLITLYELENWTVAEIAGLYKKSEGAVKLNLFRARNKLKAEVKRLSKQHHSFSRILNEDYLKNYAL